MDENQKRGTHTMKLKMKELPESVDWLVFTLSAWNCDSVAKFPTPSLSLKNADTQEEITSYDSSKAVESRALLISFARKRAQGKWEVCGMSVASGGSAHDYTETKRACENFVQSARA